MKNDAFLKIKPVFLKSYALLAAVESAVVFYYLASIRSETGNTIFAGYSLSRLILLVGAALPFILFGLIFLILNISPARSNRLILLLDNFLADKQKRFFVIAGSSVLIFFCVFFLLLPYGDLGRFSATLERLIPFMYFGVFFGAQTLLGQFLWREQKFYFHNLLQWKSIFMVAGILFAFVTLVAVWVSWSGVGLIPETYGWHAPGTPLPFAQFLVAFVVSLLFMFFNKRINVWYSSLWKGSKYLLKFETVIFLALWFTAFLVWQGEPVLRQSYFTPEPTAPNFEYYPYSDAGFYDTISQNILIGEGRNLEVVLRPLYVFFLALLHVIAGQDYKFLLALQVLSLSVIPALLFWVVSLLGNQSAGMLAAVLVIFREKNSIALTNIIEVSHSKLLLSDLPTMAFMVLLIYTLVNWLRKTDIDYPLGIVSGASFGLTILVRSQAQLLLPILLVGIAFSGGFQWRKTMLRVLVFMLGLLIVVTPWVWRNSQVSGNFAVENNEFYIRLFAGGYSEPGESIDVLPGESVDEYNARIRAQIVRYVFNHPLELARVYSSYFIHNEIISVVYLPTSLKLYDARGYVDNLPFWDDPYIDLANEYGVMFFLNLALITLGVAAAFDRLKFLGIFPLLIHLTYSLSVVIGRISGWRFVLPIDWILQFYYSIGVIQLFFIIVSVVWNRKLALETEGNILQHPNVPSPFFQRKTYFTVAGFLLIGLSLPMFELIMPVRYPALSQNELIERYVPDPLQFDGVEPVTASALKIFLETEPGATVLYGRALYPSYYERGDFWGESSANLLAASQFDRLQFYLIGPSRVFAFIPLERAPQYFPHASDVFVIGCEQDASLRVLIAQVDDQVLFSSPWAGLTCSELE